MTDASTDGRVNNVGPRFFISYASEDASWAEWIADVVAARGYFVEIDSSSWSLGQDFIEKMDQAITRADNIISLYSNAYFSGPFASAEHRAAFARSTRDHNTKLIPVIIEHCQIPALYRTLISINITGLPREAATERLLEGLARIVDTQYSPGRSRLPRTHHTEAVQAHRVPPRNSFFTGRNAMISRIMAKIDRQVADEEGGPVAIVSLQGMGGIGKTQTAIEICHRIVHHYRIVWWVDAGDPGLLLDSLLALADELGLFDKDPARTVAALWQYLAHRSDWILVYDNVERVEDMVEFRPPLTGGWLITSRNNSIARIATAVELSEFERSESVSLLAKRVPTLSQTEADQIAEALGDLPLAVELAGYFLEETGFSSSAYLDLLEIQPGDAGLGDATIDNHPGLTVVIDASMRSLEQLDPNAIAIVQLFSLLAPEPVPIVIDGSEKFGLRLGNGADFIRILRSILGLGVVKRDGHSLRMHRVFQLLVRSRIPSELMRNLSTSAGKLLAAAVDGDGTDPITWPGYSAILPHVRVLSRRGLPIPPKTEILHGSYAELVLSCVNYLYRAGRYQEGLALAQECLDNWSETLPASDERVLGLRNNFGMCLTGMERFGEATKLYRELWAQHVDGVGSDHPFALRAATNVGVTLVGSKQFPEAVDVLQRAYDGWLTTAGTSDIKTLRAADNLAEALTGSGRCDEAYQLASRTLKTRQESTQFPTDDPETLNTLYQLGISRMKVEPHSAREILVGVFNARRRVLGSQHPDTVAANDRLNEIES